jgi:hypothetical protein
MTDRIKKSRKCLGKLFLDLLNLWIDAYFLVSQEQSDAISAKVREIREFIMNDDNW